MNRKTLCLGLIMMVIMVSTMGCSQIPSLTDSSSVIKPKIIRQSELGTKWTMQQMQIEVAAGDEVQLLLKLANADRVDGYFYLLKGDGIEFQVVAAAPVYESQGDNPKTPGRVTSDRFTFTASQAQGTTYTLIFRNPDEKSKETKMSVFTEIVYPITGSIFAQIVTDQPPSK
jgi:hypothetical protein